jgi:hypothetical protein
LRDSCAPPAARARNLSPFAKPPGRVATKIRPDQPDVVGVEQSRGVNAGAGHAETASQGNSRRPIFQAGFRCAAD